MATTLTISIDRASLGLPPLVLYGHEEPGTKLGISDYQEPSRQARVQYAGASPWIHGATAVAATWQQALLAFDVLPDVDSESELRQVIGELREAVSQFSYETTVAVNGAQGDVWRCDMGSVAPAPRSLEDLEGFDQTHTVTIPCHPIPVGA